MGNVISISSLKSNLEDTTIAILDDLDIIFSTCVTVETPYKEIWYHNISDITHYFLCPQWNHFGPIA